MQNTFLSEVAQQLYSRYGSDISSLTIVVPTRRARLFLSEAISKVANRPIWQPEYMSMDDVMHTATPLKIGNKIRIISELYKVYSTFHDESFDQFYAWGETLLSDFNLIDNYMIDADMLFRNIYDLKVLESDLSYLTPEMRDVIHSFWSHFPKEEALSAEKKIFRDIWLSLAKVYHQLKERLSAIGIAYQGMIYRSAADNIKSGKELPDCSRHYVFVGFNALSKCEKVVLDFLHTNATCEFIWDHDDYYTKQHVQEAGRFISENLSRYKPTLDVSHDNFNNISKKLTTISTVSDVAQCKYIPTLLREISPEMEFSKDSAIILTDEELLMPLLHSLPNECAENINVTMGHPIRNTAAYSFINRLISLQRNAQLSKGEISFYHVDVTGVLQHPYLIRLFKQSDAIYNRIVGEHMIRVKQSIFAEEEPLLQKVFSYSDSWESFAQRIVEIIDGLVERATDNEEDISIKASYLSAISAGISEIANCLKLCDIELDIKTFTMLLHRHLPTISIPFSGEPLQGLQIMGILETRALDFKNVIILSMSDENFPGKLSGKNSFIPYNLRRAYGIPTPEDHESVYAYYFYRLIQRAERVDMLYCAHNGESDPSRYIRQLDYEAQYPIKRVNIGVDIKAEEDKVIEVKKSDEIMERLNQYLDPKSKSRLYPSSLSPYLVCPLKFYFKKIAKLTTEDELEDNIDSRVFGNILHSAMEILYGEFKDRVYTAEDMNRLLKGEHIEKAVTKAIDKELAKNRHIDEDEYSGDLLLNKNIVIKQIRDNIIPYDRSQSGVAFVGFEETYEDSFPLNDGSGREVNIAGKADRIDSLPNGNLRVVDYKTGKKHFADKDSTAFRVEQLFEGEGRGKYDNVFQTLMYSMVIANNKKRVVQPGLYYIKQMHSKGFKDYLTINNQTADTSLFMEDFEQRLRVVFQELFNPNVPFRQCPAEEADKNCQYCDFKTICRR